MLKPFSSFVNFNKGLLEEYDDKIERRLSDLRGIFNDSQAYEALLEKENSMVYEVFEKQVPEEEGQLAHAVTIIHPGKVGNEYFLTKGHFHTKENTAELYLGIKGQGGIIMQDKDSRTSYLEMKPGTLVYVAPFWAHRTINTGSGPFSFLAIYPADAGHDYATIELKGFPRLVVEKEGNPTLADNPKFSI